MKKALLLALALCGISALQATTLSWTSHGAVKQGDSIEINGAATGFSIALVFDLGAVSNSSNMNAFFSVLSETLCYSIGADGSKNEKNPRMGMNYNGVLPSTTSGTTWKTNTTEATINQNGENIIGLVFYTSGSSQWGTLQPWF